MVSVYSHHHGWVVRHKVMDNYHQSEISVVEEPIGELSGSQVVIERGRAALSKKNAGVNY